jgi:hypothetical protein
VIAVILALLAAAGNAVASVLQGRVARNAPAADAFRPRLVLDLLRRPMWLGGIGSLTVAFGLQAAALSQGGLALVQPVLTTELPFTMVLLALSSAGGLRAVPWGSVALLSAGLAVLLAAAAPAEGSRSPGLVPWLLAGGCGAVAVAGLVVAARLLHGAVRAVLLGIAASVGFAFTAAVMKAATGRLAEGLAELVSSWQVYAVLVCGLASLFLLQNALQAGSLVAAQPALTVTDPVVSIVLGVALFADQVRTGLWMAPEAVGVALLLLGSVGLARSPVFQRNVTQGRGDPGGGEG